MMIYKWAIYESSKELKGWNNFIFQHKRLPRNFPFQKGKYDLLSGLINLLNILSMLALSYIIENEMYPTALGEKSELKPDKYSNSFPTI